MDLYGTNLAGSFDQTHGVAGNDETELKPLLLDSNEQGVWYQAGKLWRRV